MNVKILDMHASDLLSLCEENKGNPFVCQFSEEQADRISKNPHSKSLFINGQLMVCGGISEYWKNRGECWAVLSPKCKTYFLTVHRIAKKYLEDSPVLRIEAAVERGFGKGHKWVRSLGFSLEALHLRKYFPNGEDATLYSKVKEVTSV